MTSSPSGTAAREATPTPTAAGADLLHASVAAAVVGTALGLWCRAWAAGAAGPVGAVLADLGGPWVVAAFAAGGAVGGRHRAAVGLERSTALLAGTLAGGGALALASLVYYEGTTGPRAALWVTLGLLVGGAAGGAGAAWAMAPRSVAGATAAAGLGLALAAEAVARFGGGLRMVHSPTADVTVLGLAGLGVLAPLLLTRAGAVGLAGSVGVAALAVPTAALLAGAPRLLAVPFAL